MSHARTVIEPDAGLTVLVGPNNCGKSAFVTALQILCHNAKSNYVLRHDEKQCEVIVETDDGHIVNWSKKKSGSPKYIINGEPFDRLRQGVPQQLLDVLRMSKVTCEKDQFDIHFGEQKSPVFLLNDSGKAAAQFFASSSDAIRLVEMQDRHKAKVRDSKRDHARLSDEKHQLTEDLKALAPLDKLEAKLTDCETQFTSIQQSTQELQQIQTLIREIESLNLTLEKQNAIHESLADLKQPPVLSDTATLDQLITSMHKASFESRLTTAKAETLSTLSVPPEIQDESTISITIANLKRCHQQLEIHSSTAQALENLTNPPELSDELELSKFVNHLQRASEQLMRVETRFGVLNELAPAPEMANCDPLNSLLSEFKIAEKQISKSTNLLRNIEDSLAQLNSEVESWVKDNPSCPTCGSETTVNQLIGSGNNPGAGHSHD